MLLPVLAKLLRCCYWGGHYCKRIIIVWLALCLLITCDYVVVQPPVPNRAVVELYIGVLQAQVSDQCTNSQNSGSEFNTHRGYRLRINLEVSGEIGDRGKRIDPTRLEVS